MTPSISRQRFHFRADALAGSTSSSEAETVSPLPLTGRDVVSVFPTGTVTAGGLSGSPAFLPPLPRKGKSAWLTTKHEITPAQSRQRPASPRSATTGPTPRTICARPATSSCPHSIGFAVHRSSTVCPTRNSPTPIISYSSVSRQSVWRRKSHRSPGIWPSTSDLTVARRSGLTAGKTATQSNAGYARGSLRAGPEDTGVTGRRDGHPIFSPASDPPDLPMADEENPSFGNNPNAPDLT